MLTLLAALIVGEFQISGKVDPITDRKSIVATTTGVGGSITVGCFGNYSDRVSVRLTSPTFIGAWQMLNQRAMISYRFDDQKASDASWVMEGGNSVRADPGGQTQKFLQGLRLARQVRMRVIGYDGRIIDSDFTFSPPAQEVDRVVVACGDKKLAERMFKM